MHQCSTLALQAQKHHNTAMKLYLLLVSLLYSFQWTECAVSSPIVIGKGRARKQVFIDKNNLVNHRKLFSYMQYLGSLVTS